MKSIYHVFLYSMMTLCLLSGCQNTSKTPNYKNKDLILETNILLKVDQKIYVFWRKTKSENPFLVKGEFEEAGTLLAKQSPAGGGGITGAQLVDFVLGRMPRADIRFVNIRALTPKKLPEDQSITAVELGLDKTDEEELFDQYVGRNARKKLVLYMDIFLQ